MKASFYAYLAFFGSLCLTCIGLYRNYYFDLLAQLYFHTGIFSLIFTALAMFFALFKIKKCKKLPRLFGIFAFFWAFLHCFSYFVFSKNLSLQKFFLSVFTHSIELSGFIAFVLMFLMFLASFSFFKKLKAVLKLGYALFFLASFHYFLSAKVPEIWHFIPLFLAFLFLCLRYKKLASILIKTLKN